MFFGCGEKPARSTSAVEDDVLEQGRSNHTYLNEAIYVSHSLFDLDAGRGRITAFFGQHASDAFNLGRLRTRSLRLESDAGRD